MWTRDVLWMEKVLIVDTHLWRFLTNIWELWAAARWRVRLWIKEAHALSQQLISYDTPVLVLPSQDRCITCALPYLLMHL